MPLNDPFSIGGGLLSDADPSAPPATTPDAQAAAQQAAQTPATSLLLDPNSLPVIPPPDMSKALLQAGIGILAANAEGSRTGGALAAGLDAYNKSLQQQTSTATAARQNQLAEYEVLGRIRDRQNAELAASRKAQAIDNIKQTNPQLASLLEIDPEAAARYIANQKPQERKTIEQNGIQYYQDDGTPVIANPVPGSNVKYQSSGGILYKIEDGKDPVPVGAAGGSVDPSLTGDAYLATLSPQDKALVKSVYNGDMAPASLSRNGGQALMAKVAQAYPDFTSATAAKRMQTNKDFGSAGKSGQTLTSINTVASHLKDAKDAYDALNNSGYTWENWAKQGLATASDNPTHTALNKLKTAINVIAPELAKITTGNSAPAEGEINEQRKPFDPTNGPDAFNGTLNTVASLIHGKAQSLLNTYQQDIPGRVPSTLKPFAPETLKTFKKLGVDLTDLPGGEVAPDPTAAPAPIGPASAATSPGAANDLQMKLEYTAKKYNMTIDQVKQKLGIQ